MGRDISEEGNRKYEVDELELTEEEGNPNYGANAAIGGSQTEPAPYGSDDYFNTKQAKWERQRTADESRANRRHASVQLALASFGQHSIKDISELTARAKAIDAFLANGA